jgi:hypothetical protein
VTGVAVLGSTINMNIGGLFRMLSTLCPIEASRSWLMVLRTNSQNWIEMKRELLNHLQKFRNSLTISQVSKEIPDSWLPISCRRPKSSKYITNMLSNFLGENIFKNRVIINFKILSN